MTPLFPARRAEEFNTQVERASTGGLPDARYADFLEIVSALQDIPAAQPRPDFVSSLRERLMTAAPAILAEHAADADEARLLLPPRRPVRERKLAAAVGGLAIVGATTSMAMAAQSALPGDALYPLKRAIENARAGISSDEADKGTTLLANAQGRLEEVSALSREGRLEDTAAIADTLNAFTEQSAEGADLIFADYAHTGDEVAITDLQDFTAASMQTLTELESVIPVDARDELLHAAQVLANIDAETTRVCPSCAGDAVSELPAILSSGYAASGLTVPSLDGAGAGTEGRGDSGKDKDSKDSKDDTPSLPEPDEDDLDPGSVLDTNGGTTQTSGGGTDVDEDPVGELTDSLSGGGSEPTSGGTALPDVGDVVDDVTDPLLNP